MMSGDRKCAIGVRAIPQAYHKNLGGIWKEWEEVEGDPEEGEEKAMGDEEKSSLYGVIINLIKRVNDR